MLGEPSGAPLELCGLEDVGAELSVEGERGGVAHTGPDAVRPGGVVDPEDAAVGCVHVDDDRGRLAQLGATLKEELEGERGQLKAGQMLAPGDRVQGCSPVPFGALKSSPRGPLKSTPSGPLKSTESLETLPPRLSLCVMRSPH